MKHSLYGIKSLGVSQTADALETLIRCRFLERESDYFGVYRIYRTSSMEMRIVSQPDPEGELLEEEFREFQTLVYVDSESNGDPLSGLEFPPEWLEKLRVED